MKFGSGPIVDFFFVQLFAQPRYVITAPRVCPAEYFCGRFSLGVDTDEAMPKRGNGNMADVSTGQFDFCKDVVDRCNYLFNREVGVDLCAAVFSCVEEAFVLDERVRKQIPSVVV